MTKYFTIFVILFIQSNVIKSQDLKAYDPQIDYQKKVEYFVRINKDSTFFYLPYHIKQCKEDKRYVDLVNAYNIQTNLLYSKNDVEAFKNSAHEAIIIGEKHCKNEVALSSAYHNLAHLYLLIGDFKSALIFHRRALETIKGQELYLDNAVTLRSIGIDYLELGDEEEAISYYEAAISDFLKVQDDKEYATSNIIFTNYKIAQAHKRLKQPMQSLSIINDCLLAIEKNDLNQNTSNEYKIKFNLLKCKILFQLSRIEEAEELGEQIDLLIKKYKINDTGDIELLLAKIYYQLGKVKKAEAKLIKSKNKRKTIYKKEKNYSAILEIEYQLADFYLKINSLEKALHHAHIGLCNAFPNLDGKNILEAPKLNDTYYPQKTTINLLYIKAQILNLMGSDHRLAQILSALDHLKLCKEVSFDLREDLKSQNSKLVSQENLQEIYATGIEVSNKLFKLTDNDSYLNDAFLFIDANKANLLIQQKNKKRLFANNAIPDDLIQKERSLIFQINYHKELLLKSSLNHAKDEINSQISKTIFELKRKLDDLENFIKKTHPNFIKSQNKIPIITLKEIQSSLSNNTGYIEYLKTEEAIYTALITNESIDFFNQNINSKLRKDLKTFIQFCTQSKNYSTNHYEDLNQFKRISQNIYNTVLPNKIKTSTPFDQLIIIPDGILHSIPFEALLTKPSKEQHYKSMPFLIKETALTYHFSASLYFENYKQKNFSYSNDIISFLPNFVAHGLNELSCGEKEVDFLTEKFNGTSYKNKQASKEAFLNQKHKSNIIHLSTHTFIDTLNPSFSKIYFTNGVLSNHELNQMDLETNLIVLGTCNSGSGKLAPGEGLMALSRDFMAANIPSMLVTKWEVDDCTTSKLFYSFYKHLINGELKSKALQKAKIEYLAQAPKAKSHPYYWAAINQIGNDEALNFDSKNLKLNYAFIGVIILLLMGLFSIRSKSIKKGAAN